MADSEKVSSLPSERERFEAWWNEVENFATRGERLSCGTPEEVARDAWHVASAGRQELLEALEGMVVLFRSVCLMKGWEWNDYVECNLARAAIQKATGEQQ